MNRKALSISILTLLLALAAGVAAPAAAQGEWQLKLSGVYAESTSGGEGGSLGGGLAIEYRATPRLGIEVGGLAADLDSESPIDFFGIGGPPKVEAEVPIRPVLARLNFHLTPDRRADVYVGPVAGYAFVDDLTVRVTTNVPNDPTTSERAFRTEDQFTWGAHAGVDVRLGGAGNRSFLSAGVIWLDLPIEIRLPPPDPAAGENTIPIDSRGDLDPLVIAVGYSYRF